MAQSVIVVVLLLLCLCGCTENRGVVVGEKPPQISGTDINGEMVSMARYDGKVVVIFFWKSSCCGEKLKLLEPFYRHNREKGVEIVAINVGDSRDLVASYAKGGNLTFTMQSDEYAMTAREYGVFGYPTLFILDRQGVLRKKVLGEIPVEQLETVVAQYLTR